MEFRKVRLNIAAVFGVLLAFAAIGDGRIYDYSSLPLVYQKAFSLSAFNHNERLEIFLETFGGYSVYQESFSVSASGYNLDLIESTPALKILDPVTQKFKNFYTSQNSLIYQVLSKSGTYPDHVHIKLQACSKENCLLPVEVNLAVTSNSNPPTLAAAAATTAATSENPWIKTGGLISWSSLLILFFAGILTAFSPCVLPMFPITLGIFARWAHQNTRKATGLSIAYGMGIVVCYAVHGLISAATGGIFGSLTQSPLYLIGIGAVIFISGLIYSGLVPFPFANFFIQVAGRVSDHGEIKKSYKNLLLKSFLMGATLGLVASPCVGPVLVSLLALLSKQLPGGGMQNYAAGFVALSIFGLGMALPFLILGHFYFRFNRRLQLGKYSPLAKYLGSALLIAGSLFFLIPGLKILYSSKTSAPDQTTTWEQRPKNRWLIVDFRADWCGACLDIEQDIFKNSRFRKFAEKQDWTLVRVDATRPDQNQNLIKKFEVLSLPTVLILSPQGKVCKNYSLFENESLDKFILRLERAKAECF